MKTQKASGDGKSISGNQRKEGKLVKVDTQVRLNTDNFDFSHPKVEVRVLSDVRPRTTRRRNLDFGSESHEPTNSRNNWSTQLEEWLQAASEIAIESGMKEATARLDKMVQVYASNIPAPRYNMREARMIAKAQEKVILSTEWVTASDISELAHFKSANKSSGAAKWKAGRKIFSVNYQSEELYPIYALDKANSFRPTPGLKPILELFADKKDNWGIAYWLAGANGYLGGKRPQDLLGSNPDQVLKAAMDELDGITHG